MRFRVLGSIDAEVNGQAVDLGPRRQQCVLVALLADVNNIVSADELADRVWGEAPPRRARDTLYAYLSRLRRVLAVTKQAHLLHRSNGYQLVVDEGDIDLYRFRQLIDQGRSAGTDEQAVAAFAEGLALWRGDAFHGLDTPWISGLRGELDRQRLHAELDHTDRRLRLGQDAELIAELSARTAAHPLDERLAGQLLLALARSGQPAAALDRYERIRSRLAEELGTDPSPELRGLHQQILTSDPAILAAPRVIRDRRPVPSVVPRQLPPAPRLFAGRAVELAALSAVSAARVDTGQALAISVVGGAGGVGKTWLALHWAHRNLDRFPDGQLFVNLRGFDPSGVRMSTPAALRCLLDGLGVDMTDIPADFEAQVGLYRSLVAGRRMLILIDNVGDAAQVDPLLPGSASCTVLITSRDRLTGLVSAHGAQPLLVDMLPDSDARALLALRLGDARLAAEPESVADLLACCAGLPLALSIVAGRAQELSEFPLSTVAADLHDAASRLAALDDDPTTGVRACLSWSYSALSPAQARVFGLLGLAPGPDISLPAAANLAGLDLNEARIVLRGLVRVSLLQQHAPDRYRMHDLVRLYASEQASRSVRLRYRRAALLRLMDFYTHTAHRGERLLDPSRPLISLNQPHAGVHPLDHGDRAATLAWFEAEHACLLAALELAVTEGWDACGWRLAWAMGTFHWRRGHQDDNIATWRVALVAAQRLGEPTYQAQAHRRLGLAFARAGDQAEAAGHLGRALDLSERVGDVIGQAHTHESIAWVHEGQGEDEQALRHAARSLELLRTADCPVWEAYARSLVGWYHARLGRYDQAAGYCATALSVQRGSDDREGQADTLDSLGYIAHRVGRYALAIDYYTQARDLAKDLGHAYAEAHRQAALGDVHNALGQPDDARQAWQAALDLYADLRRGTEFHRVQQRLATQLDGGG